MNRDRSKNPSELTEMANVNRALQRSVERYSALLKLMQQISTDMLDEKDQVEALVLALAEQQRCIEVEDATLLTQLERIPPEELTTHAMFHARLNLMEEIKEMNDLLLPKINGIMALIFQEIGELKCGRNAVSRYRTQGQATSSKRFFTA